MLKTFPNKDIIASIKDAVKDLQNEVADTVPAQISLNSFMTEAVIIWKPVHRFANQWTGFYMITASVMKELNFKIPNLLRMKVKL